MSCKKFDICRDTIVDFVMNEESFTYEELAKTVIDKGGVLRVSTQQTPMDYLNAFEEKGYIKYIPVKGTYHNLNK